VAKLKAPLLSLGASGQLAKTLVFFGWKGLNVAREYVVPANPKTASQVTQRGYVTAAVAAIHAAQAHAVHPLNETDQVAYSALAAVKGIVMTWFNMAVKLWIDVKVAAKIPMIYHKVNFTDPTPASFDMSLQCSEEGAGVLAAGKFYFGTTKTNLIHSQAAEIDADSMVWITDKDLSAFLTAGTKYYCQFRPDSGDDCEGADSGIYHFVAL